MSIHTGPLKALRTKNNLYWKWRRRKKLNEKAELVKVCKEKKIKGYKKNQKKSWRRVGRTKGLYKSLKEEAQVLKGELILINKINIIAFEIA